MTAATDTMTEPQLWEAAWRIAYVGASNPVAVARTLAELTSAWRHTATPTGMGAVSHPALQAIAGHLAYLHGVGLGPELDTLRLVQLHAHRMELDPAHVWTGNRISAPRKIAGAVTGWSELELCPCGATRAI